jgi:predicted RND superfamily exporter protein
MAIIPFGFIGTVWGHHLWQVDMQMFTVVGFIGMTGIIINDSIVLVTTIDDYAKKRGLIPAVIEATCDRLRPVLLTTLTTVLGLAPLLYETSHQTQVLRPVAITLVYGLGIGMFIVLLLVPALIAVQLDFGRMQRSLRRGMGGRHSSVLTRAILGVSALLGLGVVALTTGRWAVLGQAHPMVETYLGLTGTSAAFAGTALGAAVITLGALVVFLISSAFLPKRLVRD